MWAPDYSYANISASNFGNNTLSINEVKLDGAVAAEHIFVSGHSTVDAGETVTIQVSGFFVGNVSYQFSVVSSSGAGSVFVATAPEPSLMFRAESGTMENVTEEVTQMNLDEDVSVGGSVSSNQSDCFVESDLENYAAPPKTVLGHFFSGFGPSYFYALNKAKQYVADISARKALLLDYSEFQKPEVNGGTGLVWEPIDLSLIHI